MILQKLLFALLVYQAASQNCDEAEGWHELNGYCFRVSTSAPETQYHWMEAREFCMAQGGDLASIHTQEEQDLIVQLATDIGLTGLHLWIGLNDLDSRSGSLVWSDGSVLNYTDWANSNPKTGGLTYCTYSDTETGPGDFVFYPSTTALYGIINPDYDYPTDADGIDTFYFGTTYDYLTCQGMCEVNSRCAAATYYDYHYLYYWSYVCMGRSDKYNVLGPDTYASSGVRSLSGGDSGFWYSANCGLNKAFACKKEIGSDTPITVTPTPIIDSYCPDGYFSADQNNGNKCFKMVEIETESQGFRWEQALLLCRAGPGVNPDLASINSLEENSVITSKIQGYGWGFWIGLHYTTAHNYWVWADNGEPVYYNWATGEPSGADQCVEMWSMSGPPGKWNNQQCDQRRGYICQTFKDADNIISTPAFTTPHDCASGWTPYWYGCYQLQSDPLTWTEAVANCESKGSTLVSIHSEPENSAIFIGAGGDFPLWLGYAKDSETGEYYWVDGWPNYYANFDIGGTENGEGCVVMKSNAKWNDTQCGGSYPSVCKKTNATAPTVEPPAGYCPTATGPWIKWGAHCYHFSAQTDDFTGALADCRYKGGDLVSIETAAENDWILTHLIANQYYYSAWIGLYRHPQSSNFTWTDGSTSTFRNWGPGEPSNPLNELCVEMRSDTTYSGMWFDNYCDDYYYNYYVCQTDQVPEPTYPTVPTPGDGECPSAEWVQNGDSCFLIRPVHYMHWQGALETCKYLTGGLGSLASIRSAEENQFIWFWADYLTPDYEYPNLWIGLYKIALGYPYMWEDGTTVDFTYWAPTEPNDYDGTNNCVRMYLSAGGMMSMWDDYLCSPSYENGYVCRTALGNYRDLDLSDPKYQYVYPMPKKSHDQEMELPQHPQEHHPPKKNNDHKQRPHENEHMRPLVHNAPMDQSIHHQGDLYVEDSGNPNDGMSSQQVIGTILAAVAGTVIITASVFIVYLKKKRNRVGQQPESKNSLAEDVETTKF